jgi:hypothetical protein
VSALVEAAELETVQRGHDDQEDDDLQNAGHGASGSDAAALASASPGRKAIRLLRLRALQGFQT